MTSFMPRASPAEGGHGSRSRRGRRGDRGSRDDASTSRAPWHDEAGSRRRRSRNRSGPARNGPRRDGTRNVGIRPAVDVVADGPQATAAPLQPPQLLWDRYGATLIDDRPAEEAVADAAQPESASEPHVASSKEWPGAIPTSGATCRDLKISKPARIC